MSSPVLTTTVSSASGAAALSPRRNRAPPMPPASATTRTPVSLSGRLPAEDVVELQLTGRALEPRFERVAQVVELHLAEGARDVAVAGLHLLDEGLQRRLVEAEVAHQRR